MTNGRNEHDVRCFNNTSPLTSAENLKHVTSHSQSINLRGFFLFVFFLHSLYEQTSPSSKISHPSSRLCALSSTQQLLQMLH